MQLQVFIIAFTVSYLGSIPPGTINITTMQMAVSQQRRAAFFFALAASLTEFFYTALTVRFQIFLSESPTFTANFKIISAAAMLILGVVNLAAKSTSKTVRPVHTLKGRNGFLRGVILGISNPLTIPFWLAVTAFLDSKNWISLEGSNFWIYNAGVAAGTLVLLLTVREIGTRFTQISDNRFVVHKIPGLIFIGLGLWNLIDWLFAL